MIPPPMIPLPSKIHTTPPFNISFPLVYPERKKELEVIIIRKNIKLNNEKPVMVLPPQPTKTIEIDCTKKSKRLEVEIKVKSKHKPKYENARSISKNVGTFERKSIQKEIITID